MNKNDKRILSMREKIEQKKVSLTEAKQAIKPLKTHCSLEWFGVRYNIRTLTENHLVLLMCNIHATLKSATELKLSCEVSDFDLAVWIEDLNSLLSSKSIRKQDQELVNLEATLRQLLTDDTHVSIQLDELEKRL